MKEQKSKKEVFYEVTLKLIYEKGFKATTLRDIANQLNFEVANVYNYISTKDAFLEEHIFGIMEEFHSYIDDISESSYSPQEKLRHVISKHIDYSVKNPYIVALLIYEWRNLKEPRLGEYIQTRDSYFAKVDTIIEEGMKSGEFRQMRVDIATILVFSSIRWLFNYYTDGQAKPNPIEMEKAIMDFVFNGLSTPSPT